MANDKNKIDELNIEIKAKSTNASTAIKNLVDGLGALDTSIDKLDVAKISGLEVRNSRSLSTAGNALKRLSEGVAGFSGVDSSQLKNLSKQLSSLGIATQSFTADATATENMRNFGTGLKDFATGAKNIKNIDFDALSSDIVKLTQSIKPLTDEMIRAGSGATNYGTQMKELVQASKMASNQSSKGKGGFYNFGSTFFKWSTISMAINAMRSVTRTTASAINGINNYIESINLFTVAMGDYTEEAKTLAEEMEIKLGIDSGEAMKYMGYFQQLTTSFGLASEQAIVLSKNMTQLGYDLASFYNLKTDEAFLKLQSGIAGEIEPLTLAA